MRFASLISICLLPFFGVTQTVSKINTTNKGVEILMPNGLLGIYPLTDNTVRVKFIQVGEPTLPELIFISEINTPEFKVTEPDSKIEVKCKNISVFVNKQSGQIEFANPDGKIFLSEKAGSRIIKPDSIHGEPCYFIEQQFESPVDEFIFGLGQFQDGHYNIKGITRRLTQVNSQIAIPFVYSSKGYGLLWHQYGLTDFNPTDNFVTLEKQEKAAESENLVEVTTTAGTQKVSQNQSLYTGKFSVPEDGEYSIFLDLGSMGNRHYVVIDSQPVIDQTNMWLPPTAGVLAQLKAGVHEVQLVCKSDNTPTLSWKQKDNLSTFRSPNAKSLDYVVFSGLADEVIGSYRNLSGNAPMFPQWAYGFWQCRERYSSGSQLVETVKEFRTHKLPMDVIVQDWQYWGSRGWGVPQFDETHYPNPAGFIKEIHDLNAHFNISIWSNPDKNSTIGKEYVAKDRFIKDTKWLDYFNPETRKEYWTTLKINMFDNGVDSWWMDAVEPENDALKGEKTYAGLGDFYRLTYPLMVSQAVYEGQREATSDKRVCILTRSAFSGQQRYGVINWSGDIGGDWDTYKRQIVAGLNFTLTGMPYWTTDIGGFFRPGSSQYTSESFHEILIRWFQWGALNPIFRIHGYMSETEPWKYGQTVENNMRKMLNLRYRLLPYIYSEAWQVTKNGSTLMRPMVMDFSTDPQAVAQAYEFMFGKSFLVAPITEPSISEWNVYLPKTSAWYDFWTGTRFDGGQTIKTAAPLDKIPLFVKAGSIVPMGAIQQYAGEKPADTLEIRVYAGANGEFTMYEDENDNYNYEKGAYSTLTFTWNDAKKILSIGEKQGTFPGSIENRTFNIVLVNKSNRIGSETSSISETVSYQGKETNIKLK
jgi:alpha-D-xyloside xylohydrolase